MDTDVVTTNDSGRVSDTTNAARAATVRMTHAIRQIVPSALKVAKTPQTTTPPQVILSSVTVMAEIVRRAQRVAARNNGDRNVRCQT